MPKSTSEYFTLLAGGKAGYWGMHISGVFHAEGYARRNMLISDAISAMMTVELDDSHIDTITQVIHDVSKDLGSSPWDSAAASNTDLHYARNVVLAKIQELSGKKIEPTVDYESRRQHDLQTIRAFRSNVRTAYFG